MLPPTLAKALTEELLTIVPPPLRSSAGIACLQPKNVPLRLMPITRAVARPMPFAPPVTIATLPLSRTVIPVRDGAPDARSRNRRNASQCLLVLQSPPPIVAMVRERSASAAPHRATPASDAEAI